MILETVITYFCVLDDAPVEVALRQFSMEHRLCSCTRWKVI